MHSEISPSPGKGTDACASERKGVQAAAQPLLGLLQSHLWPGLPLVLLLQSRQTCHQESLCRYNSNETMGLVQAPGNTSSNGTGAPMTGQVRFLPSH